MKFLLHRKVKTTKCVLCDARFAPIKLGEELCAHCNTEVTANRDPVTCVICNTVTQPLTTNEIAICWFCGHDPDHRLPIVRALKAKVESLQSRTEV
jgi:hypothetical protein